jgi:hypothetical protein
MSSRTRPMIETHTQNGTLGDIDFDRVVHDNCSYPY